ncbi:ribonuclease Oy-like [Amphibalanus amphitrite]|uniref:ribonuclease Oy-like n=1 Tax=Amphibalanus amphitrite TaxID=1232801 RepID=UPI001C8FF85D|nr:ribonuclease Oy-like [Amphibalanus amphitrite]
MPPAVDGWAVHGLWPDAAAGNPYNCSGQPLNATELAPARAALLRLWPEVYADRGARQFWQHEWQKHGTCALAAGDARSQLDYFVRALELGLRYDPGAALRRPLLSELRVCVDRRWQPVDCYPPDGSAIRAHRCDGATLLYPPLRHEPVPRWPDWLPAPAAGGGTGDS